MMTHSQPRGGLIKAGTGIEGFDTITGGGLPQGRTTVAMGGPGVGKTVFALQSLLAGVGRGEPGIFVTFQESPRQILENAAACGWNLPALEKDKLVILDSRIRPNVFESLELFIAGMLAGIQIVAAEMRAKNIVFDSVDALFSVLGDGVTERQQIFWLRDWLLESGLTAIITAQAEGREISMTRRHAELQFAADCVLHLHHGLNDGKVSRHLRVVKYRGSGFAEREISFLIGASGIKFQEHRTSKDDEVSSNALAALRDEIASHRAGFQEQIRTLTEQLAQKQAELDMITQDNAAPGLERKRRAGKSAANQKNSRHPLHAAQRPARRAQASQS